MIWYREDFVTINDGRKDGGLNNVASAGPYCGKDKPPTYKSPKFWVEIRFISDGLTTRHGFKAKYKCIVPPVPTICGGSFYGPKGRLVWLSL